jgi:hypothetical protein
VIVWRGWGILVIVITAACVGLGGLILSLLGYSLDSRMDFVAKLFMLPASIIIWFVGRWLNRPIKRHSLFFIPMEYWGVIIGILSLSLVIAEIM